MSEADVAKVVPDRIFSIAVHPSPDHLLVVAGDKRGKLGFFEPDYDQEDNCVTVCNVHSRPITSIMFDGASPQKLYTSAYDSMVRLMDVHSKQFVATWNCDEVR